MGLTLSAFRWSVCSTVVMSAENKVQSAVMKSLAAAGMLFSVAGPLNVPSAMATGE